MRLNFNLYGSPHTFGWLPEGGKPLDARQTLREAVKRGFDGVELPTSLVKRGDMAAWKALGEEARAEGMEIACSAFGTDVAALKDAVDGAAACGATLVRTVVGGAKLGGDRREFNGGKWKPFMEQVLGRLR